MLECPSGTGKGHKNMLDSTVRNQQEAQPGPMESPCRCGTERRVRKAHGRATVCPHAARQAAKLHLACSLALGVPDVVSGVLRVVDTHWTRHRRAGSPSQLCC